MSHIFISYSHKDSDYAHRLAEALEAYLLDVWIDDRIDYGAAWPRVIQEKIDTCEAFIVIMTSSSYVSDWVQNELTHAKDKKKPIFPVLLEGSEPWLSVRTIQYVDVRTGELPPENFFKRLIQNSIKQKELRGEVTIVPLSPVRDGQKLLSALSGIFGYIPKYDEPQTESEMQLIRDFLQSISDLQDYADELEGGDQVEVAFSLSQRIDELKNCGLYVYAGEMKRRIARGSAVKDSATIALIIISKQEDLRFSLSFRE